MILEQEVAEEIRHCVDEIRALTGMPDIDLLLNKRTKRWVVVQRLNEAKLPVDPLVVDCLPNPDNPPPRTNIRSLFEFKSPTGGYLYPPAHPITIANMVREWAPRSKEAWRRIEESKRDAARAAAKERAEMIEDMTRDAEEWLRGKRHFAPGVSPGVERKEPTKKLYFPMG